MKRNNIFMLAYIVFIFVSANIKLIYDFPMWSKIVVAVTTASWIFAISDCCASVSNFQKDVYETEFPLLDTIKFRIGQIKKIFDTTNHEEYKIKAIQSSEVSCINSIKIVRRMKKLAKILEIVSVIFTFSAFLLFLFILCFDPPYHYFFKRQEGFTVISFGMILIAQFIVDVGRNYTTKVKKDLETRTSAWEALLHSYELEKNETTE